MLRRFENCDCMDLMREYTDKFFDIAIVDPPYGIDIDDYTESSGQHGGRKAHKKKSWDTETPPTLYWKELKRVSKNMIVFGANYFSEYLPPSMGWIVWDKGQRISQSDGELIYTSYQQALRIITMNRVELLKQGTIHPTEKPIKLYQLLISRFAKQNDIILDTHVGSAASLIAYEQGGLQYVGCELNKDYYSSAKKRLELNRAQTNLFEGSIL